MLLEQTLLASEAEFFLDETHYLYTSTSMPSLTATGLSSGGSRFSAPMESRAPFDSSPNLFDIAHALTGSLELPSPKVEPRKPSAGLGTFDAGAVIEALNSPFESRFSREGERELNAFANYMKDMAGVPSPKVEYTEHPYSAMIDSQVGMTYPGVERAEPSYWEAPSPTTSVFDAINSTVEKVSVPSPRASTSLSTASYESESIRSTVRDLGIGGYDVRSSLDLSSTGHGRKSSFYEPPSLIKEENLFKPVVPLLDIDPLKREREKMPWEKDSVSSVLKDIRKSYDDDSIYPLKREKMPWETDVVSDIRKRPSYLDNRGVGSTESIVDETKKRITRVIDNSNSHISQPRVSDLVGADLGHLSYKKRGVLTQGTESFISDFRSKPSDYEGRHGGGSHINLETYSPIKSKKKKSLLNIHYPLED